MYEDIARIRKAINQLNLNSIDYKTIQSKIDDLNNNLRPFCEFKEKVIKEEVFYIGQEMGERLSKMAHIIDNSWMFHTEEVQNVLENISKPIEQLRHETRAIQDSVHVITDALKNYYLLYFFQNNSDGDDLKEKEVNTKIIKEIFKPDL